MAKVTRKKSQFKKEAIVKVFNKDLQRYTDVIIPSSLTVGLPNSDFQLPLKLNGSLEFKTTAAAPKNTDLAMYVVGSTLYFNGSAVGGSQDLFKTFAVSGQSDVVADSPTDTMTFVAGSNMTITTDAASDSITFASTGGGSGGGADDVGWSGPSAGVISTTGSLGIGTTAPDHLLEVTSDTAYEAEIGLIQYNNTTAGDAANLRLRRGRGTAGSPAIVQDGDNLGTIHFAGHDGTDYESYAASIWCEVDGTPGSNDMPGRLIFKTTADGGVAESERMRITNAGKIGIGTDDPSTILHVEGDAVTIGNGATGPGEIRLLEDTDLGSYYAGFKASNLTENTVYEMPTAFPASNKILQSDSSGVLTWVADDDADGVGWVSPGVGEITTTGSVGIGMPDGSTSPTAALEIDVSDSDNKKGLFIDFDETGNYNALEVDSESTTYFGAYVHGKYGVYAYQDLAGGQALRVERNIAEAGTYPLASFTDDHTSNTQTTVTIRQDGTGDILNLFDGATEVFTVLDGGYVGIGTAGPSGSLDVKGDGSTSQVFLLSGSGAGASPDESSYADVNFFVSGAMGSKDSSTKGTAIFGGDVVISGTLHGGTPLKVAGGMEVTGTMELKPSAGGVAIVRNPHGPVKLFASSALKLGSNIGTIDLLDLGDGAAGQILMKGQGALAERSVELNSPGTLFFTGTVGGSYFKGAMDVDGNIVPGADNTYNLGSSSRRFANIYTGDLHLQNERGHWQIIEERDYLCVVNRLTGKRYKMALEPMDDDE